MRENLIFCPSLPDAFAQVGMVFPERAPEPGKWVRFSTNGKPGDTAGWCRVYPDGVGAAFGCNRDGTSFVWQQRDNDASPPSKAERQAARAKAEQVRQQADIERAAQYAKAAETAPAS